MNYTVTEVESLLKDKGYNISKRTINSYAFEKKILEVSGGKKAFSDEDIKKLEYILKLKECTKYTLEQIKKILEKCNNEEIENLIKKNISKINSKYIGSNNLQLNNLNTGYSANTNYLNNNLSTNTNYLNDSNSANINYLDEFNHDYTKTNKNNVWNETEYTQQKFPSYYHGDNESFRKVSETFKQLYENYKPDFEGFEKGEIIIYYKNPNQPIATENILQIKLYIDRLVKKFKLNEIEQKEVIKDKEVLNMLSHKNIKVVSIDIIKQQTFQLENGDTILFNNFEKYEKNNVYEKIIEFINLFNY